MASPAPDTASAPAGTGKIYAGRAAPAWRRAMTTGTWAQLSGNTLASIDPQDNPAINPDYPANAPWHAIEGQPGMLIGWSGGCWDDERGELWLPLQGGHSSYAGNEPYRRRLAEDVPGNWEMLRNPTGANGNTGTLNDGLEATGIFFDGRPRPPHTYGKHVYVPGVGPVMSCQGNVYLSGQAGTRDTWSFNAETAEWTKRGTFPGNGTTSGMGACWDATNRRVWAIAVGLANMCYLDVDTWTWTGQAGRNHNEVTYVTLVYVPPINAIVAISNNGSTQAVNGVRVWDCGSSDPFVAPTISGTQPAGFSQVQCGASWCPSLGKILAWNNATDTTKIATLTPASLTLNTAWQWGELTVSESNAVTPTAKVSNGTYNRFGYSEKLKGCYLQNYVGDPTYFFATEDY